MNTLLLRLYPASWRARYGEEFEALLEERPLGPFDVADVLLSAIDAHLRPRGAAASDDHTRGVHMTLRNGGIAATFGGSLWIISLAGASASSTGDGPNQLWLSLFIVSLLALIVAIVGLSAEQGRRQPAALWAAVALPVVGAMIAVIGSVGMATVGDAPFIAGVSPWNIWALGLLATIIGSGLFALVSVRVRALSRVGTSLLAAGAIVAVFFLMGIAFTEILGDVGSVIGTGGIVSFAAGWVWLGVSAIRTDRAASAAFRSAIP